MQPPVPQLWERRLDEPDRAYVHFLLYRNLGPARTLKAAHAVYCESLESTEPKAATGPARPVPGDWKRACEAWAWRERADAWDIYVLTEAGERTVVVLMNLVADVSLRALRAVYDVPAPGTWKELLVTIHALCQFIPQETFQCVLDASRAKRGQAERVGQPPAESV